ncbi:hypothetical protein, partial [Cognatishimia activa]|uniref:hypothetical protein n=1 Tax=Cognatishimia activa TaxID=1715691 RepID=UPI000AE52393
MMTRDAPIKIGRFLLIFVSGDWVFGLVAAFFDIVMYLKRYVGGLVVIDDWTSVYLVPRILLGSMMELTASLFVGLCFLWKPSTQTVYPDLSCR